MKWGMQHALLAEVFLAGTVGEVSNDVADRGGSLVDLLRLEFTLKI